MKRRSNSEEKKMTLRDAFKHFFEAKLAINLSRRTLDNYEDAMEVFYKDLELDDDFEVANVNEDMWFRWVGRMRNRDLSVSSINHYIRSMRAIFNYCIDKEYMGPLKMKELKGQEVLPKEFDNDDLALLLEYPKEEDNFNYWRSWLIVCWVLATGNRIETVRNIRVDDIDFKEKTIRITQTKNNKSTITPLTDSLEKCIKKYLSMWQVEDYLFPDKNGRQATYNALRIGFQRFCDSRGVEQHNLHGLRHSFSSNWIKSDGNVFKLQQALGHSSLAMTRRYVALYGGDLRESYQEHAPLDNMIKTGRPKGNTIKKRGK